MCANAPRDYTQAAAKRLPAEYVHNSGYSTEGGLFILSSLYVDFPDQLTVAFLLEIIFAQLVCRKEHVKSIKQYLDRICYL